MRRWAAVSDAAKTAAALGAGLIGVAASTQGYLPVILRVFGIWMGLLLCTVAVFWAGAGLLTETRRTNVVSPMRESLEERVYRSYTRRAGTAEDIDVVFDLSISIVGAANHISPKHMADLMKIASKVFWIIERDNKLAGYFIIYPLKARPCQSILSGTMVIGHDLRPNHLCSEFAQAHGIYLVQVIGAPSPLDRTAVLIYLRDFVREVASSPRSPLDYIFARPGTKAGQRWLTNLEFEPITRPRSQIWVLGRRQIREHLRRSLRSESPSTDGLAS